MVYTLFDNPGPHPVGATTFAITVDVANPQERILSDAKVKATAAGHPAEPALKLEEVAFTAFYPARIDTSGKKPHSKGLQWIPRPVGGMLRGYAHFSKWTYRLISWILHIPTSLIKIPVYPNTPLLDPQEVPEFAEASWPLVLFSHGLAGNRTNYSHICSRLASQGNVVLAFEHRDGTGPYVETVSTVPGKKGPKHPDYRLYLHPEDVIWDEKVDRNKFPLRRDQLRFRRLEIYLGYASFKKFVEGSLDQDADELPFSELHTVDGPWNFDLNSRSADRRFWESWCKAGTRPKVECDRNVCLAGHSFGGATVLDVLSNEPPTFSGQKLSPLPVTHAIALDPWIDPLPSPGPAPYAPESSMPGEQSSQTPQLMVINSEGFTLWDEHYNRLAGVVRSWNDAPHNESQATEPPLSDAAESSQGKAGSKVSGSRARLITLVRAQHISFSDFGVLLPFGRYAREGRRFLSVTEDLVLAFLGNESQFEEVLEKQKQVEGKVEEFNTHKPDSETEWKKRIVGEAGDIVVH